LYTPARAGPYLLTARFDCAKSLGSSCTGLYPQTDVHPDGKSLCLRMVAAKIPASILAIFIIYAVNFCVETRSTHTVDYDLFITNQPASHYLLSVLLRCKCDHVRFKKLTHQNPRNSPCGYHGYQNRQHWPHFHYFNVSARRCTDRGFQVSSVEWEGTAGAGRCRNAWRIGKAYTPKCSWMNGACCLFRYLLAGHGVWGCCLRLKVWGCCLRLRD